MSNQKTFLHVGCGPSQQQHTTRGFNTPLWKELRFDIDVNANPHIVGTMTDMSALEDGAVDALFSSHNIEHLYAHEVGTALNEFRRVIRDDGFCVITCPDLKSVCALVAEDKLTDPAYNSSAGPIAPIDILYGHRASMARGNLYMAHRCGFTEKVMITCLKEAGFGAIVTMSRGHPYYDIWALATVQQASEADIRAMVPQHFPV